MEAAVRRLPAPPPALNKVMSEYVTVVSVGAANAEAHHPEEPARTNPSTDPSGFVTVLKIGDAVSAIPKSPIKETNATKQNGTPDYCVEQVLVYRLPGERLGFGLKFEGGTKAAEFVKRLFIQSCAPDSPASRVRGSWGVLTEGDEVLAIDNIKVTSMTRIDCVRCLKDSNVVIQLQVRHRLHSSAPITLHEDGKTEAPLVISAEKKRTPPPPPPVPPRKGPKKKDPHASPVPKGFTDSSEDQEKEVSSIPKLRRISQESLHADVIHPPDAEVYLDLFSQEQESYCLSESDDTGSSISTVVDRFGSFPTTTTSSFAGSMPSTPTAVQKRIHQTNPFDVEHSPNEELLFERLVSLQAKENQVTLQPPANFQDAPLSYANEDVRIVEAAVLNSPSADKAKRRPPPPPPPRTKHQQTNNRQKAKREMQDGEMMEAAKVEELKVIETNNNDYSRKDENMKVLPRLVDFVPKSNKSEAEFCDRNASEVFIRQEQLSHTDIALKVTQEEEKLIEDQDEVDMEEHDVGDQDGLAECGLSTWARDEDAYPFAWSTGQPLSTIGEVDNEDESLQDIAPSTYDEQREIPAAAEIVVEVSSVQIDNVDGTDTNGKEEEISSDEYEETLQPPEPAPRTALKPPTSADELHDKMDTRQPPDGHEFPDYHESSALKPAMLAKRNIPLPKMAREQPKSNVKNMIAMFSHTEEDQPQPTQSQVNTSATSTAKDNCLFHYEPSPMKRGSMSDLTEDAIPIVHTSPEQTNLHKRSQSLVDISSAGDRWLQLLDQRRRGLSKLKGLIIPEHPDTAQAVGPPPMLDLPEIKSAIDAAADLRLPSLAPLAPIVKPYHVRNNSTPSLNITAPIWNTEVECAKYSPAFKRKTLQVYSTKITSKEAKEASSSDDECRLPSADAPKSLESITSPTRSDCSFEYASMGSMGSSPLTNAASKTAKSEDESDNDSAVSSSQSSYISRQSPPASPNHLFDSAANRRLLKAQSVEAINRKNILASAKCRSGKDLNGSPLLIQRKFDEADSPVVNDFSKPSAIQEQPIKQNNSAPTQNGLPKMIELKQPHALLKPLKESKVTSEIPLLVKSDTDRITSRYFSSRNQKAASVTDLRKNFEKSASVTDIVSSSVVKSRARHSVTSNIPSRPAPASSKRNSLPLIAPNTKTVVKLQDKQNIIASTVKSWEDEGISATDVKVIALRPEIPGGSIGITLAGGTDYETKDITIHKVRNGSVAHRDGRLRKGERVLSINGKSMNAITHAESMAILKEPVAEVIIVTSPPRPILPSTPTSSRLSLIDSTPSTPSTPTDSSKKSLDHVDGSNPLEKLIITVKLTKNPLSTASGLGFSMEGGKGSPQGDVPLLIKKLFTGGLADKSGMLAVGDELVAIQDTDVTQMPRIDAWSLMKKLPPGEVSLTVRR